MSSYEFGGCLYRTQGDLLRAVAEEWITSGGDYRGTTALANIANETDEHLADECIAGWELDGPRNGAPGEPEPMRDWGITREDLIEAMAACRAALEGEG